MVAVKSPELATAELNVFRGISLLPEPLFLELGSNDPTPAGAISVLTAPEYLPISLTAASWNSASEGKITNAVRLIYPECLVDWGLVQSVQIRSASKIWYALNLKQGRQIAVGDTFYFDNNPTDNLMISLFDPQHPDQATKLWKNLRLDVLRQQSIPSPSACKIHLSQVEPDIDGNIVELVTPGYVPADYGVGASFWSDPGATRKIHNLLKIEFPQFLDYSGPIRGYALSMDGNYWLTGKINSGMIGWKYGIPYILPEKLEIAA